MVQPGLAVGARGEHQRFPVCVRQREQGPGAHVGTEAGCDGVGGGLRLSRVPGTDPDRLRAEGDDGNSGATCQSGGVSAVAEAWLDTPAHGDAARYALDPPDQFPGGRQGAGVGKGQCVGHPYRAACGGERRFQHVGARQVTAGGRVGPFRLQEEPSSLDVVEHGGEQGRRVKVRPGQPVHRAVPGDERDAAAVPDHRVVPQFRVSVRACRSLGRNVGQVRLSAPAHVRCRRWRTRTGRYRCHLKAPFSVIRRLLVEEEAGQGCVSVGGTAGRQLRPLSGWATPLTPRGSRDAGGSVRRSAPPVHRFPGAG